MLKKILGYLAAAIAVLLIVVGLILAYLIFADFQYNEDEDDFNENGNTESQYHLEIQKISL